MILRRILLFWVLLCSLLIPVSVARAEEPAYLRTAADPPRPPETFSSLETNELTESTSSNLKLRSLKAVLLVGPIDGDDGEHTKTTIEHMELTAEALESHGITVHRFYPGNSEWEDIEAAARGAHFFVYRGHGIYDGNLPSPEVGGLYLSSGYYSPDRIRDKIALAPGAIVMIYACFAAGTSSVPDDMYDIGIEEASRRVAQYSEPFFDVGAGGYYANWYSSAFPSFINNLFEGDTLGTAYENYWDFNAETVHRTVHSNYPNLAMWVDKDYYEGDWDCWVYNNAFAGQADKTLEDLFPERSLAATYQFYLPFIAKPSRSR